MGFKNISLMPHHRRGLNRQLLEYFGQSLESVKNWGTNHAHCWQRLLKGSILHCNK
jgi:hypothetical protein